MSTNRLYRRKKELIKTLNLHEKVENGYLFGEFPSNVVIPRNIINTGKDRLLYSFAYYLISDFNYGPFHLIEEWATWQVCEGCKVKMHMIYPDGTYSTTTVGPDIECGERFCVKVPPGVWQACELLSSEKDEFSLISHFVIPAFDYSGRRKGTKEILTKLFPQHSSIIDKFYWDEDKIVEETTYS